jgi:hypothetical protein
MRIYQVLCNGNKDGYFNSGQYFLLLNFHENFYNYKQTEFALKTNDLLSDRIDF